MSISTTVRTAMQQTNEVFSSSAVKNHNLNALDDVYTIDARILPPGADLIEGRTHIKEFWQQAIAGLGLKDAKLTTVDAEMAGDTVVELGKAELTLESGQVLAGKYIVHWKQEDGKWKWHTDMWNMNQ